MGGFDDHIEALVQSLVTFQGDHLRAGDHDIANALVGDVHNPFEHFARIFVDKVVLPESRISSSSSSRFLGSPWKSWFRMREKNPFLLVVVSLLCELSSLMAFVRVLLLVQRLPPRDILRGGM